MSQGQYMEFDEFSEASAQQVAYISVVPELFQYMRKVSQIPVGERSTINMVKYFIDLKFFSLF